MKYLFCIVLSVITNYIVTGQYSSELGFITTNNPIESKSKNDGVKPNHLSSFAETNFLFMSSIKFYQQFISSQQSGQVCLFYPSCSHFGQQAIKKYGMFHGFLMTSDRLQRCNSFSMKYYKVDLHTGKCFDNTDNYYLGKKK